jgi:Tol biopolymer transport system component/uncharacterized protein YjdB
MLTMRKSDTWRPGLVMAAMLGVVLLSACADDESTGPGTPPPAAVATVQLAPETASLLVGGTVTLLASPRDANNQPLERPVAWTSSNVAVATVSATGLVTALAEGDATISATSEGKAGTAVVRVARIPVAEVRLNVDAEVVLAWNGTARLQATALDAEGRPLAGRTPAWQSNRPDVVSVAADGSLTAQSAGIATVTASIEGKHASVGVQVLPVPVAKVTIAGSPDALEAGETVFLAAVLEDVNGAPVQRPVTWTSDNPAVATAESTQPMLAAVHATGAGRVTITATVDGQQASVRFAITPRPTHDLIYARAAAGNLSELFVLGMSGTRAAPIRLNAGNVSREPSPSPDGTQLVFAISQRDLTTGELQEDLFIVRRDGLGMRRLTSMAGYEHQPRWSPDGQRILFRASSDVNARPNLWVINVDGTGLRNLTATLGTTVTDVRDAAWSPDGARIAYIAAVRGQHKVWIMQADGTAPIQLTVDAGFDSSPAWAPAGDALAFTRWNTDNPAMGEDVMIVPIATGIPHRLAMMGDQRQPAWSPDGHYIAITGTAVAGTGVQQLYTMRPDGTGLRLRTTDQAWGGGLSPSWIRR